MRLCRVTAPAAVWQELADPLLLPINDCPNADRAGAQAIAAALGRQRKQPYVNSDVIAQPRAIVAAAAGVLGAHGHGALRIVPARVAPPH